MFADIMISGRRILETIGERRNFVKMVLCNEKFEVTSVFIEIEKIRTKKV